MSNNFGIAELRKTEEDFQGMRLDEKLRVVLMGLLELEDICMLPVYFIGGGVFMNMFEYYCARYCWPILERFPTQGRDTSGPYEGDTLDRGNS